MLLKKAHDRIPQNNYRKIKGKTQLKLAE